ncbi:MAG TPA: hypothetical protein VF486_01580 [Actinomycetes bacterium]
MTRIAGRVLAPLALAALVLAGCGGSVKYHDSGSTPAPAQPARQVTEKDYDPAAFAASPRIDNRWFPLAPGTQLVYTGTIIAEGKKVEHRVVFTVTDLTKVVDGVRSMVMFDRDYNGGVLAEAELAFHAQDKAGNVWNMGEYPEEYEGGKFTEAPDTWLTGTQKAKAGILMRVDPRTGTSSYSQGVAPAIDFSDAAKVSKTGVRTCVPTGCYDNVLVTDEWNPGEPDAHQLKFYAPGVGNVRVEFSGGEEKEHETLVLSKIVHLDEAAMAEIRAQSLKLDKRAYTAAKAVYADTQPAERTLQAGQSP